MRTGRLLNHLGVCAIKLERSLEIVRKLEKQNELTKYEISRIRFDFSKVDRLCSELFFRVEELNKLKPKE